MQVSCFDEHGSVALWGLRAHKMVKSAIMTRATVFPRQIPPNSAAQFVKFCEIPRRYYAEKTLYIRGQLVLLY